RARLPGPPLHRGPGRGGGRPAAALLSPSLPRRGQARLLFGAALERGGPRRRPRPVPPRDLRVEPDVDGDRGHRASRPRLRAVRLPVPLRQRAGRRAARAPRAARVPGGSAMDLLRRRAGCGLDTLPGGADHPRGREMAAAKGVPCGMAAAHAPAALLPSGDGAALSATAVGATAAPLAGPAPAARSDFSLFLGGFDAERFFQRHWEQRSLHIPHGDPRRFASLISHETFFEREVHRCRHLKASTRDASGWNVEVRIQPEQAFKMFRAGMTICASMLEETGPIGELIATYRRGITTAAPPHVNCYYSPDQRGYGLHFDTHPVFILQVAGSKHWTVSHAPAVRKPPFHVIFPARR